MAGSEPARVRLNKSREAEERRLIEAAQRDRARFAEVYERYFELVYAYAVRRVLDRAMAEDLTSEVFHKAFAHLPRFKWTGAPFGAWLIRIAANLIADRAKRAARERGNSPRISKGVDTPSLSAGLPPRDQPRAAQTQQSDLEASESRAQVFRLVDQLAKDQRQVVIMRFAEDRSIREIARKLGRSEGAVKQLQFRALQTLRAKLGNE
jgi:RNA polymerase sigma-70 factor (ECF subfamily)